VRALVILTTAAHPMTEHVTPRQRRWMLRLAIVYSVLVVLTVSATFLGIADWWTNILAAVWLANAVLHFVRWYRAVDDKGN
jgi:uncharacterized membrane-anchored protein